MVTFDGHSVFVAQVPEKKDGEKCCKSLSEKTVNF